MSNESTVLVLGASGMLGNAVLRYFSESPGYAVVGAVRSAKSLDRLPQALRSRIIFGLDAGNIDSLSELIARVKPDVVVNCVGLVKQLAESGDPLAAIPINSLLPHRLLSSSKVSSGIKLRSESREPGRSCVRGRGAFAGIGAD